MTNDEKLNAEMMFQLGQVTGYLHHPARYAYLVEAMRTGGINAYYIVAMRDKINSALMESGVEEK